MRKKFPHFLVFLSSICSMSTLFSCSNYKSLQFIVSYDLEANERVAYLFSNGVENNINEKVKIKIEEGKVFNYKYRNDLEVVETTLSPNQFHFGFGISVSLYESFSASELEMICSNNDGYLPDSFVLRYDVESLNYKKKYNATVKEDKSGIELLVSDLAFPDLKEFDFNEVGPLYDWKNNKIVDKNDLSDNQECYFAYYFG